MDEHISEATGEIEKRPERWRARCHVPSQCVRSDEDRTYVHVEVVTGGYDCSSLNGIASPAEVMLAAAAPMLREALETIVETPLEDPSELTACVEVARKALAAIDPGQLLGENFGGYVTVGAGVAFDE